MSGAWPETVFHLRGGSDALLHLVWHNLAKTASEMLRASRIDRRMVREITKQEYCHENLGDVFAGALSEYDTSRRVTVLVDEFLADRVQGKQVLDVGCGLGFFSQRLSERGARVTACDIGPSLVEATRARVACDARVADAMELEAEFGPSCFDVVVSSECIEHTPDPERCVIEMIKVLRPGGLIALSTPNLLWYPMVKVATVCRFRPFTGHENFSTWNSLRRTMRSEGVQILSEKGLHLFPFQLGMHRLSSWIDEHGQLIKAAMINICVLGRKSEPSRR